MASSKNFNGHLGNGIFSALAMRQSYNNQSESNLSDPAFSQSDTEISITKLLGGYSLDKWMMHHGSENDKFLENYM